MLLLLKLLAGHALCDYPLQGDFLARGKNHTNPIPGVPYWHCLWAHALIHGGMVAVLTHDAGLGVIETIVHAGTDYLKCSGKISYNVDQIIHVMCKVVYWYVL